MKGKVSMVSVTVMLLVAFSIAYADENQDDYARYICDNYNWDSGCATPCGTENLDIAGMTADWYTEMKGQSGYGRWEAVNTAERYWLVDPDKETWGHDDLFAETHDILLVGGHGARETPSGDVEQYRLCMNRSYSSSCKVWPRSQLELGEGDIELLQMVSCSSMTTDNSVHSNTWQHAFEGIHQVHGFHGRTYSNSSLKDDYYRVANHGFSNAVAEEWVDELYEQDFSGSDDNCPCAYTGRNSQDECSTILHNEEYDTRGSYSDIVDPTSWMRLYVDGCDPYGAGPM